jgi:hypothetical protein
VVGARDGGGAGENHMVGFVRMCVPYSPSKTCLAAFMAVIALGQPA